MLPEYKGKVPTEEEEKQDGLYRLARMKHQSQQFLAQSQESLKSQNNTPETTELSLFTKMKKGSEISGDGMTQKILMSRERWEMHWRKLEMAPTMEAKREAAKEYHEEMECLMKAEGRERNLMHEQQERSK